MEKIAVVTDTGSNLSFEQAKELGIYLLPLQITIDETTYQDTLEISTQDIYIIHSDFLEGANHFKKCFIEKGVPEENIHINYISSVIAVHTGLGCIALQYIRKEN